MYCTTHTNRVESPTMFPSFAAMRNKNKAVVELGDGSTRHLSEYQYSPQCGCLILDDYHVLTAAHCTYWNTSAAMEVRKQADGSYKTISHGARNEDLFVISAGTVMYHG